MRLAASRRPLSPCQAVSINARRRAAGVRTLLFSSFPTLSKPSAVLFHFFPALEASSGGRSSVSETVSLHSHWQSEVWTHTSSVETSRSVPCHLFWLCNLCSPPWSWDFAGGKTDNKVKTEKSCISRDLVTQLGCVPMTHENCLKP